MRKYIKQIIQLVQNAKHVSVDSIFDSKPQNDIKFNSKIYYFEVFGVKTEELPLPESLSEEELQQLLNAFNETATHLGFEISLPDNVPNIIFYELLRQKMSQDFHYDKISFFEFIDFCDGCFSGHECKLYKYCLAMPPTRKEISDKIPIIERQVFLGYGPSIKHNLLKLDKRIFKKNGRIYFYDIFMTVSQFNKVNLDWYYKLDVANFSEH